MSSEDNYRCQMCGSVVEKRNLVIDHIIPKYLGGSNTSDNLITLCRLCSMKSEIEYKEYLWSSVNKNTNYFNTFQEDMNNINKLLKLEIVDSSVNKAFYQMLYSNVITTLETYLSDAFINTVIGNNLYIRRLIETDPEFKKRKFELSQIFKSMEEIKNTVLDYLLDIIYHNIGKVQQLYKNVLQIEFPSDLSNISKAVKVRHDLVHRNGKEKNGDLIDVGEEEVLKCAEDVYSFVKYIDEKLRVQSIIS
ncbi:HNH endonuclease signature motif containing protein [Lysinibacillus pakistanensis]|uniref:HNH endonuclease n=1 Tax=Lysinibacillus pakistanensis TaxID=759811 RepID=UPI003D2A41A4